VLLQYSERHAETKKRIVEADEPVLNDETLPAVYVRQNGLPVMQAVDV
jgi:hypothetical protein